MKTIQFTETETAIDYKEFFDLMEDFQRNLVVGLECERAINIDQRLLAQHLKCPFIHYGESRHDSSLAGFKKATANEFNVAFVTYDSSVLHNNEVLFTGTSEKFGWIHDRLFKLETKLDSLRCLDYDKSTSNHITLLTLQDKIIKPIVLKNLYNLTRAFSPALYWLCSGDKETLVRRNAQTYCSWSNINPSGKTIHEMKGLNSRSSIINLSKQNVIGIAGTERLSGFLVEFRNTDGFRVPSALTSLMMMYKALTYKAIELSTKGLLSIESLCDWDENKRLCRRITDSNNELVFEDMRKCEEQANELIDFILPQLKKISPEAIPILRELSKKPISQRSGKWVTIESKLLKKTNKKFTANEEKLVSIILNGEIRQKSAGKWKEKVSEKLGVSNRMIEYLIKGVEIKTSERICFDSELQSYILQ